MKIPTGVHDLVEEYRVQMLKVVYSENVLTALEENNFQDSMFDYGSDKVDNDVSIKFLLWKKNDDGYLKKMEMKNNKKITCLKQHIYTKRVQFVEIQKLQENLTDNRLLIQLDYSENYKCQQQNEVQGVHFIFSV